MAELVEQSLQRLELREAFDGIYDLERLSSRISMASANAKDLVALRSSLERLPALRDGLQGLASPLLEELTAAIDPLDDVAALIGAALVDDPPFVLREGGLIRDGFHAELDELRRHQPGREGVDRPP